MKEIIKYVLLGMLAVILIVVFLLAKVHIGTANATQEDKIYWCHVEPNGNQETLHLPIQALAGHVDAQGNILHAGDHPGECVEPTQGVTPTVSPTPVDCDDCVTPTVTPTVEPTATPSPTVEQSNPGGSDGLSDHRSDGLSSCPSCTQAPNAASPYDGQPVVWK